MENSLPEVVEDNIYFCIRSSKQEMQVFVGDELRHEYSTSDTRLFGKLSAVAWVFVELTPEDSGKTIRVEVQSVCMDTGEKIEVEDVSGLLSCLKSLKEASV